MKKIALSLMFLLSCFLVSAQQFDYDVDFQYLLDNGSYGASMEIFEPSTMINAAVVTPYLGIRMDDEIEDITHRVMFGLDYRKDLGYKTSFDNATEFLLFYNFQKNFWYGATFSAIIGAFPRSFSEGYYDNAFFSDHNKFNDRIFDGLFVKYRSDKVYAEIGADYISAKQEYARQRLQALTAACWNVYGPLSLGLSGRFYYFGESVQAPNTVLYAVANPYIKFSPETGLDKLDIIAGWIQTYQHDIAFGDVSTVGGVNFSQCVENWGLGIDNNFFFGEDLMPFYSYSFNDDVYARNLYWSKLFYHTKIKDFSFYDRAEVYYSLNIASYLNIKIAFDFHFANPTNSIGFFRGWQQVLSINFDLGAITSGLGR